MSQWNFCNPVQQNNGRESARDPPLYSTRSQQQISKCQQMLLSDSGLIFTNVQEKAELVKWTDFSTTRVTESVTDL